MRHRANSVSPNQPDPDLLHRLFFAQQVCLALVVQLAVAALCARPFQGLGRLLPAGLIEMHVSFALAALFAALSLFLSDLENYARWRRLSRVFAGCTAVAAVGSFFEPALSGSLRFALRHDVAHVLPGVALILLSAVLILLRAERTIHIQLADVVVTGLYLLVAILISEFVFGALHFRGSSLDGLPTTSTLACLAMLTAVVILREAERGLLRVFLERGIAGRIARVVTPILLTVQFLREIGRAQLESSSIVPRPYSTAIFASLASVVSLVFLIFLVTCINRMEMRIHDLTLRDELTGLYNVRGFNLLAGQSLRLAQRAEVPFSVLFIDMDNLKRINDELGHHVGSATLVDTAKLLKSTFRDADVIARMGGDEFVVAGQFSHEAVAASAQRLQDLAASRFSDAYGHLPLGLSIGYATSADHRFDSLRQLVARADQAMYDKKRRKKAGSPEPFRSALGPVAVPSPVTPAESESFAQTLEIHSPS